MCHFLLNIMNIYVPYILTCNRKFSFSFSNKNYVHLHDCTYFKLCRLFFEIMYKELPEIPIYKEKFTKTILLFLAEQKSIRIKKSTGTAKLARTRFAFIMKTLPVMNFCLTHIFNIIISKC